MLKFTLLYRIDLKFFGIFSCWPQIRNNCMTILCRFVIVKMGKTVIKIILKLIQLIIGDVITAIISIILCSVDCSESNSRLSYIVFYWNFFPLFLYLVE